MPPPAFHPVRFGVFKSFQLGDMVKGPETMELEGEEPQKDSVQYGDKGIMGDRGNQSFYRIDLKAVLLRGKPNGIPAAESYEAFVRRRFGFLVNMRKARGYWPATNFDTTFGTLAVGEDASQIMVTTGAVSAGASVNIPVDPTGRVVVQDSLWYIFDTNNHEAFLANAGVTSPLQAQTLVNAYASGAFLFRATFVALKAALLPGIKLDGDGEGAGGATKDIGLSFETVEDPVMGAL